MVSLMNQKFRCRSANERGAAAAEFALVAPLFFVLIGFLVAMGLALLTKYQLYNIANSTVRTCTAMQRTGDTVATVNQCLVTQLPIIMQLYGGTPVGCDTPPQPGNTTPQMIQLASTGVAGDSKRIYLVPMQRSCNVGINPLTNILGSILPTQVTVYATSAMPFVLGGR